MPQFAVARSLWMVVIALSATQAVACGDDVARAPDSGSMVELDAALDASVLPPPLVVDAGDASMPPPSWRWDGGLVLEGEICAVRIAAQCDGPEDCPLPGGGLGACCGRLQPSDVSYASIKCEESCGYETSRPLCHKGQVCTADGNKVCRTSFVIPDDFIGICAEPNELSRPPTGEAVVGKIDCGAEQCNVGSEQCCLREGYSFDDLAPVSYEPYCAPIGQPCDCTDISRPPRDGSVPDEDAG